MSLGIRVEHDLLGDREVPADAYYGVHTLRATENFPISGIPLSANPELVTALACVKQAAAMANCDLGLLEEHKAGAIIAACQDLRAGRWHEQFVVDVIQGGAGTSTNMNANEVIANLALERLGRVRGDYGHLHPLDDVNRSQSTNDVYPSAVKLAVHLLAGRLLEALAELQAAFAAKSEEFAGLLKVGRTQLQDAVPMTLGQEFATYAVMVGEGRRRLQDACGLIREINLGATAIGTGITTSPGYAKLVCAHLADLTGIAFVTAPDLVEATQDVGAFVQLSGVLKRIAVKLSKICNDLRLLSSGPRAGWPRSGCPRCRPAPASCPGRSTPSSPRSSTRSLLRSSATTSRSASPPKAGSCSSTPSSRSSPTACSSRWLTCEPAAPP